jgi:WD40 repeat protein
MSDESSNKAPPVERTKTDATGDFFSVGTPLHAVRAGYVVRKADELLYDTVVRGRYAHVLAPDRSGKTSLVAATTARLEAAGSKVAILDLAQIGVRDAGTDPGRWYYNVAYRLLRQLRIRHDLQTWWHDHSILSNRQRLVEFYSEIVLRFVSEQIVVFVDEIQCIENLPFADQLLASIRAAHNARTTDPEFSRLTFVLLGECDPVNLVTEPERSPFNVTQQILLDDFSREQLELFATELNLEHEDAEQALDRIYYWTRGQPYLSQKLARQVARDVSGGDISAQVDHIATRQLAGRAALQNEPHMSHIHRIIANDELNREALLTLYGRVRKGIEVSADFGSALQRRLMAVGLLEVDHDGNLRVRNRLYEAVFTSRWANENLPMRIRVPLMAAGVMLLFLLIPFWYTQLLPRPYMAVMASPTVDLESAQSAFTNLRSFPGHADTADTLFREFLEQRASLAVDASEIDAIAELSRRLPNAGRMGESFKASFWDRQALAALRAEQRDPALLATLQSLVLATPHRRQRAASLIADDYPLLLASLPPQPGTTAVFEPSNLLWTLAEGAHISQWSYATQELQRREDWTVTALEVVPLVRRVIVDRDGAVSRIGLTLNLSHSRLSDLRIKVIAPSGRTVEIETGRERTASNEDIRIPSEQLSELLGESLRGTWSISVRDEALGVAGQLVGWNLKLNSQGAVENFQRGLNIPDPVERETENVWFDNTGRYAVARAMQSDSARIWDLAFAEPVRAISVNENETLVGLDAGARHLITSTQSSTTIWDTATGDRVRSLPVGTAGSYLTRDGMRLFVEHREDAETRLELWSIEQGTIDAELSIAGVPALIAVDGSGERVAVADYDRAVRVWDLASGELLAQFDLPVQPSEISLAAGGTALGVVHGSFGVSLWSVERPSHPLLEEFADGNWRLVFSPSGASLVAGRTETGFRVYSSSDGRLAGPPIGVGGLQGSDATLSFSADEQVIFAGNPRDISRFWRAVELPTETTSETDDDHLVWQPSADRVSVALPGAKGVAVGDTSGHVHILPAGAKLADVQALSREISFVGHTAEVTALTANKAGTLVASVAADNSIRVWDVQTGKPLPYVVRTEGDAVSRFAFGPSADVLAIVKGAALMLVDVSTGAIIAEFDLGVTHRSLSFAGDDAIYLGSDDGVLRRISREVDGAWSQQQIWRGNKAIRQLARSPRGNYLVLVDEFGAASLLNLEGGDIGKLTLTFPGPVDEVSFGRSSSRAYFRTTRWVHRVSLSGDGLHWVDSVFAPKPVQGGGIVFGSGDAANRAFLPTARNGFVELAELAFPGSSYPALFGNYEDLLIEWRARLGVDAPSPAVD